MCTIGQSTTVLLVFPNIERTFTYEFPYDPTKDRVEEACRAFYEKEAGLYFALYGYGPMDIKVLKDDRETWSICACYQESLWHVFFKESDNPWFGRFSRFATSLINYRHRYEQQAA